MFEVSIYMNANKAGFTTDQIVRSESMSFDIVRGSISKPQQTRELINGISEYFNSSGDNGTLYLGYPLTANSDNKVTIDALMLSEKRGMVAFIFGNHNSSEDELKDEQDALYYHLDFYLKKYGSLRQGRKTIVIPTVITFIIEADESLTSSDEYVFSTPEIIIDTLENLPLFDKRYYRSLCEALQKVTNIRPNKKRSNISKENSKGWIIREVEKEIANLDEWQKKAALEVPDGPQRIRGLAGTGKTIVLALKAAYLHTQYPDWNILITFYTRSLRQQYEELIEKFVNDFSGEKPDWDHINILHSWGSQSEDGVYYRIARKVNAPIHTFSSAINRYGRDNPFKGMCEELMSYVPTSSEAMEDYDAVLIDEAQDLPGQFFKMIYKCSKSPKRIIWAYDELQNLSDVEMPSIDEMFGLDEDGNSIINIENIENEPQRDIILPICYRNPPWTLAMAHALGFGIYNSMRKVPLQMFDSPKMWRDIGYSVVDGRLDLGRRVTIERKNSANPEYFERLLSREESIFTKAFESKEQQYKWVAEEIAKNIKYDELDPDDILVVFPEAYTSKTEYMNFSKYLRAWGIESFLAGVNSSQDTFRNSGYVTCSGIYRAKGNESPMVYIINSEYCVEESKGVKQRNILFTAITRSRAWVRICGVGLSFKTLEEEFSLCKDNNFRLSFKCPNAKEMQEIRKLNRERTEEEKATAAKAKSNIDELISLIERDGVDSDMVPELETLLNVLKKKRSNE